jgi:DNA repair protein RadA/Sms
MKSEQTIFSCTKCGAQYPKWQGRCLTCGAWSTIVEESSPSFSKTAAGQSDTPIDLSQLKTAQEIRTPTKIAELDRVLGGGIVRGSFMLLGGDPGVGKSTLALQICGQLKNTLYASGEESAEQVKLRANRLPNGAPDLKFLPQTDIDKIIATAEETKPELLVIDSIQTIYTAEAAGSTGNVSQITACASKLMGLAKSTGVAVLAIGHVTKDGLVAGPKTLEHLVDTVMYLENDDKNCLKILRAIKNRFGSVGEIGVFEMTENGLKEISDPTQVFIDRELDPTSSGIATTMVLEGTRPFLCEIQALSAKTFFGYPQRKTTGFDLSRLQMLLAVIGKHGKMNLADQDIYLNIAGGLKIKDTGADLAAVLAIVSANLQLPLGNKILILGEVGLSGEIRTVSQLERRLKEGQRLGFDKFIIPKTKVISATDKIKTASNINEALMLIKKTS